MSNKIMALNPKYQIGLDLYQRRHWRRLYLGASERAKRYYEIAFYGGVVFYKGMTVNHDTEEEKQDLIAVYRSLTDEDWNYIIDHVHCGMVKRGLSQAREKYGRKLRLQLVQRV